MPLAEINDINALTDNKPFFDQSVENKPEAYEKRIEITRNDDWTTGNSLDYLCHQSCCQLISIHLSRQINASFPEETDFTRKLEEDDGGTMFFIAEK